MFRGVCGDEAVDEAVLVPQNVCIAEFEAYRLQEVSTDEDAHANARVRVWMAPVRGGSWSFLRRAGVISSKRRAFGGCLGTRRR